MDIGTKGRFDLTLETPKKSQIKSVEQRLFREIDRYLPNGFVVASTDPNIIACIKSGQRYVDPNIQYKTIVMISRSWKTPSEKRKAIKKLMDILMLPSGFVIAHRDKKQLAPCFTPPSMPSPAGTPSMPSPAGTPSMPSPAGTPSMPSPAGTPSMPSPASTPKPYMSPPLSQESSHNTITNNSDPQWLNNLSSEDKRTLFDGFHQKLMKSNLPIEQVFRDNGAIVYGSSVTPKTMMTSRPILPIFARQDRLMTDDEIISKVLYPVFVQPGGYVHMNKSRIAAERYRTDQTRILVVNEGQKEYNLSIDFQKFFDNNGVIVSGNGSNLKHYLTTGVRATNLDQGDSVRNIYYKRPRKTILGRVDPPMTNEEFSRTLVKDFLLPGGFLYFNTDRSEMDKYLTEKFSEEPVSKTDPKWFVLIALIVGLIVWLYMRNRS
jgi:hypothetical protein